PERLLSRNGRRPHLGLPRRLHLLSEGARELVPGALPCLEDAELLLRRRLREQRESGSTLRPGSDELIDHRVRRSLHVRRHLLLDLLRRRQDILTPVRSRLSLLLERLDPRTQRHDTLVGGLRGSVVAVHETTERRDRVRDHVPPVTELVVR